jgi:hypothetical protein
MIRAIVAGVAMALAMPSAGMAQEKPPALILRSATPILLITTEDLSSKTSQKGQLVNMVTKYDILVDGAVAIPAGTKAVGKISDVLAKGFFGQSGSIVVEPMYIRVGDDTVRLIGRAESKGSVSAGAVVGLLFVSAGFTGRSAIIPAGSELNAEVLNQVELPRTK